MTDKKAWWSTEKKIRIALQTFNPVTKVAELCREHNLYRRIKVRDHSSGKPGISHLI